MHLSQRHTILFDIDGTLLRTRGAGFSAIDRTFHEMFGIDNQTKVPAAGRTDYAILSDLFAANEVDFEEHYESFSQRYHVQLETTLQQTQGDLLPGVTELLEQLQSERFQLGIVTGNAKTAAALKLKQFGLDSYFQFGGFGDNSPDRNVVAAQAVDAASEALKDDFQIQNCWVIGDTPADVMCANSVGAKSVAVLTGGFNHVDFNGCNVNEIVADLTHLAPNDFR
ncbi:HAD hydrolase-like protein [bacterium]|nr:HAD hydrolase-like protein [bacterium]